MNLALAIVFLWVGAACLWLATHDTPAATPWEAYGEIIKAIRKGT